MEIDLLRSLSGNSLNAWFEGDLSPANQARAIEWYKAHHISAITIGWSVYIDLKTGTTAPTLSIPPPAGGARAVSFDLATIEAFARLCSDNGLTVVLKPYFGSTASGHNIGGDDYEWNAANQPAVMQTMAAYLAALAPAAQRAQADSLIVGTENANIAQFHRSWWVDVIDNVRAAYKGLLGYSEMIWPFGNFRDIDDMSFADKLDYIGANLYARVTASTTPTLEEAVRAWTVNQKSWWLPHADATRPDVVDLTQYLKGLSDRFGKPLVLTETGYPASDGAGMRPSQLSPPTDVAEQDLLLRAQLQVMQTLGDWFGGFLLFGGSGYEFHPGYEFGTAPLQVDLGYGLVARPSAQTVGDFLLAWQRPLLGGVGDDVLVDGAGDNVINGGAGHDVLRVSRARADVSVDDEFGRVVLKGAGGTVDIVKGVERIVFSDTALAFDGHAGEVARILGALFGTASLRRLDLAGVGLNLLDNGTSFGDLVQLAVDQPLFAELAGGRSHPQFVDFVYRNVFGSAPSAADRAHFVGLLDNGVHTQASLALLACETDANAAHIGLVGLMIDGLAYLPFGG